MTSPSAISSIDLSRLRWRSRRGMLENDLMLEVFFEQYQDRLSAEHVTALYALLEWSDQDIWRACSSNVLPPDQHIDPVTAQLLSWLSACQIRRPTQNSDR